MTKLHITLIAILSAATIIALVVLTNTNNAEPTVVKQLDLPKPPARAVTYQSQESTDTVPAFKWVAPVAEPAG